MGLEMPQTPTASSSIPAGGQETLLSVRNLATHFPLDEGNVVAVDDVSFDLYEGETLGIVGESGCGKSVTALSIMRLIDRPGLIVRGEILFRKRNPDTGQDETIDLATLDPDGEAIRSIRGAEIAYIFQEPMTAFSPVHTIGNQLIEAIMLHRSIDKRGAREVAIDLLRQVDVPLPEQRLDAYSFELSGGLRQRVMIAMVLSSNPRVLIADEPTTALDVTTQAQILDLLRGLQQQSGMAIILITHDLGVVAEMADNVAVMYLGQVVESAPVDDIFHAPSHPYTQGLLRSIPSIRSDGTEQLATIAGVVPHPYSRPEGCLFHPRCPSFMAGACELRQPTLQPVALQHNVSCFLYHDDNDGG